MKTKYLPLLLSSLLLGACAIGPDYVRPDAPVSATFKEAKDWRPASPQDHIPRGKWWEAFKDPVLNELEEQVLISNQNIRIAEAQFRQAQAAAQQAQAGLYPTLGVTASESRGRTSSNSSSTNTSTTNTNNNISTNHTLSLSASWEADVWGKLRRATESGDATAAASAADLEAATLSARASVAQNYFLLRVADEQQRLYKATLAAYERQLKIVQNQYDAGMASKADVAQAITQLKSTEAQALDVSIQRAQLEHAIAILLGKAPAEFSLVPAPIVAVVPDIPTGLPSDLLERRPDVAAAERRMAAANAQIGVAKAAWFPALTLSASGGYQSTSLSNWFTAPAKFWAIGPQLALTLFDAGARSAKVDSAGAAYDQTVASYRQIVLSSLQDVEDNLVSLRVLESEAKVQDEAAAAARAAAKHTQNHYDAGTVSYLSVVTTEATALSNERTALTINGRRYTSAVLLIKALGGGWQTAESKASKEAK